MNSLICKHCGEEDIKFLIKDSKSQGGYRKICKICRNFQNNKKGGIKKFVSRHRDPKGFKTCNTCQVVQENSQFYKSTITKDKLIGTCKLCRSKQDKEQYKNIKYRSIVLLSQYRRIDKKKGFENDLTKEFILSNIISQPCFYCRDSLENIGCDRIDNQKGHCKNNVVPCCDICNSVRSNVFSMNEMLSLGAVIKAIKINRNANN